MLTLTFNLLYFFATETRNRLEDQTHPPTHTEKAAEGHLSPFFGSPEMKTWLRLTEFGLGKHWINPSISSLADHSE